MMKVRIIISALVFSIFSLIHTVAAQNQSDGLILKGNIASGGFHYHDSGSSSLSPFGASFIANASLSYRDFSVPVGIAINNQGTSFQTPFNRYGISPTYKWAKVHLGWRRMRFSKFTMKGIQFFGAGVELNPGLFHLSAMTGKVDYRLPNVPQSLIDQLPDRKIMAAKIGVGNRRNQFHLTFMKANDEVLTQDTLANPKENAVIGTELKLSMFKNKIIFSIDGGVSIFTENRKQSDNLLKNISIPRFASSILEPNNSTHINYAVESELGLNFGMFSLKNTFRRIMPEYQSLGLNYLRNDIQSFTTSPSLKLWKNKLIMTGTVGIEQNNLDNLRNLNQNRLICGANLSIRPNLHHNIMLQYSNYSFDQSVQFDSLLTNGIVIKQVNKTYGGSYNFNTTNSTSSRIWSMTINLQNADNIAQETINNRTISALTNYTIVKIATNRSLNVGLTYFDIAFLESNVRQAGFNLGYSIRGDYNQVSFQGGSLIDIENNNINTHFSARFRRNLTKSLRLVLSSRARYNQLAEKNNRMILRSGIKLTLAI